MGVSDAGGWRVSDIGWRVWLSEGNSTVNSRSTPGDWRWLEARALLSIVDSCEGVERSVVHCRELWRLEKLERGHVSLRARLSIHSIGELPQGASFGYLCPGFSCGGASCGRTQQCAAVSTEAKLPSSCGPRS